MNKYDIDSKIKLAIIKSKKNNINYWDDFFNNNISIDEFANFIFNSMKIEYTKKYHIKYIKNKIKHCINTCYEDIIYDD